MVYAQPVGLRWIAVLVAIVAGCGAILGLEAVE
jgi:hypothetical protein